MGDSIEEVNNRLKVLEVKKRNKIIVRIIAAILIVLVGILLYALLGKLADVLAVGLEKYLLRWHAGYQE